MRWRAPTTLIPSRGKAEIPFFTFQIKFVALRNAQPSLKRIIKSGFCGAHKFITVDAKIFSIDIF
jgi:hypothetical protein